MKVVTSKYFQSAVKSLSDKTLNTFMKQNTVKSEGNHNKNNLFMGKGKYAYLLRHVISCVCKYKEMA